LNSGDAVGDLGKPAGCLGGDDLSSDPDLEDPSGPFDQVDVVPSCLRDGGRHTGGLGKIISNHAIFDADHRNSG
jgi:hypothetical protein